jgi:hypothetical protein
MVEDAGVDIRFLGQPLVASWRGSVHEIGNGRRFYVTAPDEIAAFIATALRREPHEGEKS